jgi:hypothetical protein
MSHQISKFIGNLLLDKMSVADGYIEGELVRHHRKHKIISMSSTSKNTRSIYERD